MTTPVNNIHALNWVAHDHNNPQSTQHDDPQSSDSEPLTPIAQIQEPPKKPLPCPGHYMWQRGWKRA